MGTEILAPAPGWTNAWLPTTAVCGANSQNPGQHDVLGEWQVGAEPINKLSHPPAAVRHRLDAAWMAERA